MNDERWLKCSITPGQFTGEYAVEALAFDGQGFSLFAWEDELSCRNFPTERVATSARLRVRVIDQKGNLILVELPQRALENGQLVTVQADQLATEALPSTQNA